MTQEEAYRQALALESAQMNSNAYHPTPQVAALHTSLKPDNLSEESNSESIAKPGPSNSAIVAADSTQKKCGYCGGSLHSRHSCPAKEAECLHCGIVGHYSKGCHQQRGPRTKKYTAAIFKPTLLAIPENLKILQLFVTSKDIPFPL